MFWAMHVDELFARLVNKRWMVIRHDDPRRGMAERLVKQGRAEWVGPTRTRLSATVQF
jgi:hypothetical protein